MKYQLGPDFRSYSKRGCNTEDGRKNHQDGISFDRNRL